MYESLIHWLFEYQEEWAKPPNFFPDLVFMKVTVLDFPLQIEWKLEAESPSLVARYNNFIFLIDCLSFIYTPSDIN